MILNGGNKCISNAAVLEFYDNGYGMVMDYHTVLKKSGIKALANLLPPPKVRVNDHNITAYATGGNFIQLNFKCLEYTTTVIKAVDDKSSTFVEMK